MFEVPHSFYSKAHSFPVMASPNKNDQEIGGTFGTLTVLYYMETVVLVTALHVLQDCVTNIYNYRGAKRVYSPLLAGWNCVDLAKYTWRKIVDPRDKQSGSHYDLAYAVLSPDQAMEIDDNRLRVPSSALEHDGDIYCVLQGYPGNKNTMARNRAQPSAHFRTVSLTTSINSLAPFLVKKYNDFLYFSYGKGLNDVWSYDKRYDSEEKLPSLDGLSGGPIFYCKDVSGKIRTEPMIIGFFLEHQKKSGICKVVLSDFVLHAAEETLLENV